MSIFDENKRITSEYLIDKYNASKDKRNIFRIKLFTGTDLKNPSYDFWITRSDITINLDRNEVFVSVFKDFHTKSGYQTPIKERKKYYNIIDQMDLDILIHKYSNMLSEYTIKCFPYYGNDIHIRYKVRRYE
jgi:hypothetical protein